jgi:predicted SnoaL-like aldol condensation-catalyzing enzyme
MKLLKYSLIAGTLTLAALAAIPLLAVDDDPTHPATKPQTSDAMTSAEKKELKIAEDFWREVIQAHHVDLAKKYLTADFAEHNPNMESGLANFEKYMGKEAAPKAIAKTLDPAPVVSFARGDYVVLVWQHQDKEPKDPSKMYYWNSFDVLKMQNGKIVEHWDSDYKNPPQAGK